MTLHEWTRSVLPDMARSSDLDTQIHSWASQALSMIETHCPGMPWPGSVLCAPHGVEITWPRGNPPGSQWLRLLIASDELVWATGLAGNPRALNLGSVKIGTVIDDELSLLLKEVSDAKDTGPAGQGVGTDGQRPNTP